MSIMAERSVGAGYEEQTAVPSRLRIMDDLQDSDLLPFARALGRRDTLLSHDVALLNTLQLRKAFFAPDAEIIAEDSRPGESCMVLRGAAPVGQVTSIGYSPSLEAHIALAYVHVDDQVEGSRVTVKCRNGELVEAPVVAQAFFDPANARQEI